MNDPEKLRETGWRRRLMPSEEAEWRASFSAQPEAQADLELESVLTEHLNRLPNVPVASNFTARVLGSVEAEIKADSLKKARGRWTWRLLMPRAAFALSGALTVIAVVSLVSHQQRANARQEMAQSVAAVSSVASLPSPEVLQDFEAIRRLNFTPAPDDQLLALFQ